MCGERSAAASSFDAAKRHHDTLVVAVTRSIADANEPAELWAPSTVAHEPVGDPCSNAAVGRRIAARCRAGVEQA
jgi:hypothetical protein